MLWLLALVLVPVFGAHIHPKNDLQWKEFKLRYGKFYGNEAEEVARYSLWREHLRWFHDHNVDAAKTFKLGMNNFTDMVCSFFLFCWFVNILEPGHRMLCGELGAYLLLAF